MQPLRVSGPPTRARPRALGVLGARGVTVLVTLLATVLAAPVQAQPDLPELPDQATQTAVDALDRVEALLASGGEEPTGSTGDAAAPDLSLALSDLALAQDDLTGTDRRRARRLLARPTNALGDDLVSYPLGAELDHVCGPSACVHWVSRGPDAPPPEDLDLDGVPDQVARTLAVVEDVYDRTRAQGWRTPLADSRAVGDPDGRPRFDVYLADLGAFGWYGYCAPEQVAGLRFARAAYCVLDDDFASGQYGGTDPADSLAVTAAHEFFHAVQYAYDFTEDDWLREGTATWFEDVLFDDVDDNRQFLDSGPLRHPERSLDDTRGMYGDWVFFQWLAERYGDQVVREVWEQAAWLRGPDHFSVTAVDAALRARGTSLAATFPRFAVALRWPRQSFEEARAGWYPVAPSVRRFDPRPRRATNGPVTLQLAQLGSHSITVPTSPRSGRFHRLRVAVDGPPARRGTRAMTVVVGRDGHRSIRSVRLDRRGDGVAVLDLDRSRVARVVVVLANTSARYTCWAGTTAACQGLRTDDRLPVTVRLSARR